AVAFAMAGIHAWMLLKNRDNRFHRGALALCLCLACGTALLQPLSGDRSAKHLATHQPTKLAALEAHFQTSRHAPFHLGGLPNVESERVDYALSIPSGLSFLAHGRFDAEVKGLSEVPREDWP